jgi:Glycosyltransferase family 87
LKWTNPILHLLVLCFSALAFFAAGATRFVHASNDFVPVYTGARCLLHGCNPYVPAQLEQQFFQGGGHRDEIPSWEIDVPVYPPSTFLVLSPVGALSFPMARLLWFLLNGGLFVTAATLILSLCPKPYTWLATILVSIFLLTSPILLVLAQPALFAISLAVISIYLFLRGRLLPLAALVGMLSLAVKPQIGGLLLLCLLVRRIHWRHVAIAMGGALAILLCGSLILRHHPQSASWQTTLRDNLTATLAAGGSADPRPANQQAIGDVNLQALTSIFLPDAKQFNAAAYLIFVTLGVAWLAAVLRLASDQESHLLALASLAVLTLLPVYHRFYDTRLLLLTVPAVVLIFKKHKTLGSIMSVFTVLAIVSVQYRVQAYWLRLEKLPGILENKWLLIPMLRQQNLELLVLFCLYLAALRSLRAAQAQQLRQPDAIG